MHAIQETLRNELLNIKSLTRSLLNILNLDEAGRQREPEYFESAFEVYEDLQRNVNQLEKRLLSLEVEQSDENDMQDNFGFETDDRKALSMSEGV